MHAPHAFKITERTDGVLEIKTNGDPAENAKLIRLLRAAPDLHTAAKLAYSRLTGDPKYTLVTTARGVGRTDYNHLLAVLNSVINDVEGL